MKSTAGIRAVLFDLDGTVLDTYAIILESMQHATHVVLGREYSPAQLMAKVGQPLATQMRDFTDDEEIQRELLRVYRLYNAKIHDEAVSAFPGMGAALGALRAAGYRLGVVTSKRHDPAVQGLALCGVDRYFEFVVGADDWPEHKPDPGPVIHGASLLGLQPEECAYIGDSPYDLQAGNSAGCFTVAALWGMFSEEALRAERPDFECDDIRDVLCKFGVELV